MRLIRTLAAVLMAAIIVAGTVPAQAAKPVLQASHCSVEQPFRAHDGDGAIFEAVKQPNECVVGPA